MTNEEKVLQALDASIIACFAVPEGTALPGNVQAQLLLSCAASLIKDAGMDPVQALVCQALARDADLAIELVLRHVAKPSA